MRSKNEAARKKTEEKKEQKLGFSFLVSRNRVIKLITAHSFFIIILFFMIIMMNKLSRCSYVHPLFPWLIAYIVMNHIPKLPFVLSFIFKRRERKFAEEQTGETLFLQEGERKIEREEEQQQGVLWPEVCSSRRE